ncbi:hypothetical protein [Pseudoxanthomonas mexicana]|uniref:hypothetical protein n=1 Tax=Pseudoxanthomonas mexicana TaxID=128785 RepID=UPI00289B6D48|nr:hypothetical protein [Pseudoxanthomonas mexicana]
MLHMLRAQLLENPWIRATVPVAIAGAVGLLANAVVAEITKDGKVVWPLLLPNLNFWIMVALSIVALTYQIFVFRHDRALISGFTPKQYEANIRNRVAGTVAKRCQSLIRQGKIDQLEIETTTFTRLYGDKK